MVQVQGMRAEVLQAIKDMCAVDQAGSTHGRVRQEEGQEPASRDHVEFRRDLIQQGEAVERTEEADELHPPALALGEVTSHPCGVHLEDLGEALGPLLHKSILPRDRADELGHWHCCHGGHSCSPLRAQQRHPALVLVLERVNALDLYLPAPLWPSPSSDQLQQGALARTIGPYKQRPAPRGHCEVQLVQHLSPCTAPSSQSCGRRGVAEGQPPDQDTLATRLHRLLDGKIPLQAQRALLHLAGPSP
mmetsp:Transcript_8373/g.23785  ORF Transcript_8373/g.23785 Transcript_8373/m.23785 type:complete len:247 (-) Transcript_8373:7-747(-)